MRLSTDVVLLDKAERAIASARLLLADDDLDGACNRAYYAMFDAARAALLAVSRQQPETTKTHSGLIAAFGLHLVKTGRVPHELGRVLNRAHEIRLVADYRGDSVEAADAMELIQHARDFVSAMRTLTEQSRP